MSFKETEVGRIPSDWEIKEIQEIGDVISGGTPRTKEPSYWDGNISWITPKDLSNFSERYIAKGERSITNEGLEKSSAKLLPQGTVLFSSRAPIGYVAIAKNEVTTNQGFKNIVCNKEKMNNIFLYYMMKYKKNEIENIAGGSTFKEVSGKVVKEFKIQVPSLEEQKNIANILSTLDDKIEVNNKINEKMDEMAQAIFKQWFIDFDFQNEKGKPYKSSGGEMIESELGMIPKGWEVGVFRNYIRDILGGDWGKENPQGNYIKEVQCIRGADIPEISKGNEGKSPIRFILEKNFNNKKLADGNLIVEISGGSPTQSTGRITYINNSVLDKFDRDIVCTNFCRAITLNNRKLMEFIYVYWTYLYKLDVFFQFENGTTGIKNFDINSFIDRNLIVNPNIELIYKYHDFVKDLFKKIQDNGKENERLIKLRDTLLPKLMSGEIRVPLEN